MTEALNPSGLINANQAVIHPQNSGGAQTLATTQIHENMFDFLEVNGVIAITTTGTSQPQNLTFNVVATNAAGSTTLQTFIQNTTATTQAMNVNITGMYRKNDKGTITLQLAQSGAADAVQTAITLQGWYVKHVDSLHPTAGQISR